MKTHNSNIFSTKVYNKKQGSLMKQIKKQHENFKKIIREISQQNYTCEVDKIQQQEFAEKYKIDSDSSLKISQLKVTKQENINQFCRIFKNWLQNYKKNQQQNPKTKITNNICQTSLNLTKMSQKQERSISIKYVEQHELSLTTPLNQKFKSNRITKFKDKSKNYQINYHIFVHWQQFIPNNFDSTLSQYDQLRDTQIVGKACWEAIDLNKQKTRAIILQSIIEKQNHRILCVEQQPNIISYSLRSRNKSILKSQYQCAKRKYKSFEYQMIELIATLSLKKIILRPTLSYNFQNCYHTADRATSSISKVIQSLCIYNKQMQINWKDPLEINQINFYEHITLKKGIPLLSNYLLKTAEVTLKAACRYAPKEFRTKFLHYNKNSRNKNR